MKKILLLSLILLTAFCFGQEKEILKVLNAQKESWNSADIEGYMQGYHKSDSLMFIGAGKVSYGWQNTLTSYQKGYPTKEAMGILSFSNIKVKPLGRKYAFVTGKWEIQRAETELKGIFSLIFQKFNHGWKIISDHTE